MKRLFTLIAMGAGLTASAVHADPPCGSYGCQTPYYRVPSYGYQANYGGPSYAPGYEAPAYTNVYAKLRVNRYPNYHLVSGHKFDNGYSYSGKIHRHWSFCFYDSRYASYLYYDPCCKTFCYYCTPDDCYYPVRHCPYGKFAWAETGTAPVDTSVPVLSPEESAKLFAPRTQPAPVPGPLPETPGPGVAPGPVTPGPGVTPPPATPGPAPVAPVPGPTVDSRKPAPEVAGPVPPVPAPNGPAPAPAPDGPAPAPSTKVPEGTPPLPPVPLEQRKMEPVEPESPIPAKKMQPVDPEPAPLPVKMQSPKAPTGPVAALTTAPALGHRTSAVLTNRSAFSA